MLFLITCMREWSMIINSSFKDMVRESANPERVATKDSGLRGAMKTCWVDKGNL
jgi:hypothetical protein